MHTTLKTIAFSAILGSTNLCASDGIFLLTEQPDQAPQSIVYDTDPTLRMNAHGYLQDHNDRFVLGWNISTGMMHDPMNWETSRHNLNLVHSLESTVPVMQTTFLNTHFVLPLDDPIAATHSHEWQVVDMDGGRHTLVGNFVKNTMDSWFLSLSSPDALSVHRDHSGGILVDDNNPLTLTFDPAHYLLDMDGTPGARALSILWDPAKVTTGDQYLHLDLGPTGMVTATRQEGATFQVDFEAQDGSAPSAVVSSHVDETGIFHTVYADGSTEPSFELAHVSIRMDGQGVIRAPLEKDKLDSLNAIFPVIVP